MNEKDTPLHRGRRRICSHTITATLIADARACRFRCSDRVRKICPVFATSNQLLATVTLLVVPLMLVKRKINFWVALLPMLFMSVITIWALVALLKQNVTGDGHGLLVVATALLLALALGVAGMSVWSLRRIKEK